MKTLDSKNLALWLVSLSAVALAAAALVGLTRGYGAAAFLKLYHPEISAPFEKLAGDWADAVGADEEAKSLVLASRLVPDSLSCKMPRQEFLELISGYRIRLPFLTSPFNSADFSRWRDLIGLKAIVTAAEDSSETPGPLFRAVMAKVKNPPDGKAAPFPALSCLDCWRTSSGTYEDRLRLFCGLLEQAGFQAVPFGLFRERGKLLRELCLIRKDSKAWIADTQSGVIWSVDPAKPDFGPLLPQLDEEGKEAAKGPFVYFLPLEPLDLRESDIALYAKLRPSGSKDMPLFPEDPQLRFERLKESLGEAALVDFWFYPFNSLRSVKGEAADWIVDAPK